MQRLSGSTARTPSDLGVDKPTRFDLLMRGRRSIAIDLKEAAGVELALKLVERADASIEGFRPGTMERLGLGPEVALARNPRLVYGRMTGWVRKDRWPRPPATISITSR